MRLNTLSTLIIKNIPKDELEALIKLSLIQARETFKFRDEQNINTRIFKSYYHQAVDKTPSGHNDIILHAAYFTPKPNWDPDAFYIAVKKYFEDQFDGTNGNYQFKEDYFRAKMGAWRSDIIVTSKQKLDPGLFTKKDNTVMLWGTGLVHAINILLQFPARKDANLSVPQSKKTSKRSRKNADQSDDSKSKDRASSEMKKAKSELNRTGTVDDLHIDYDSVDDRDRVQELERTLQKTRRDNEQQYRALREKFAVLKKSKADPGELSQQRLRFWTQRVVELESEVRLATRKTSDLEQMHRDFDAKCKP